MKLIIFGSTGGIGQHLVTQGLAAGHSITAIARRPEVITIQHPALQVVQGDALQLNTFREAMVGQDAVLSALGARDSKPTVVYSEGLRHIIEAMRAANVRRVMCVSATGIEPGIWWQKIVAKLVLWQVFKHSYTDLVRMETVVKASGLDWTIVRPPRLTDNPLSGKVTSAVNQHLNPCNAVSRADLADYMLHHITDPATICGMVEVASP
jgi:putative NADH-flavin reductase